ncbi:MAG: hypothetical protein ACREA2_00615 [Blastocatellia bacterium]
MSVERLEIIKQQIVALSRQEQAELSRFLAKQMDQDNLNSAAAPAPPEQAKVEAAERRRRQHAEWLKSHREEYGGMYVALDGDRLLGTGRNYPEAAEAARRAGVGGACVEFVLPPDYEGYMGG